LGSRPAAPKGLRIYAVGDIHGRFDLLEALYAEISRDVRAAPPGRSVEIFIGDYVDRGPRSRDVIEWMVTAPLVTDERICLLGNHEDLMAAALADIAEMDLWLMNGGVETLLSYLRVNRFQLEGMSLGEAHAGLVAALPASHKAFIASLPRTVSFGGYLFVHAGLRPRVTVEAQNPSDLIWIREPFLSCDDDFGCIVVHGHTPIKAPEVRANRINIDTGAVFGGSLTCLVLEGEEQKFLQVP
jgi:serine/threonine protein phosphatase 1